MLNNMKKIWWPKRTRTRPLYSELGDGRDGSDSKCNVNEEYAEVFRSKSYIEIWSKVEGQLTSKSNASTDRISTSSSPSHPPFITHLLEPRQEVAIGLIQTSVLHALLTDYFTSSFDACNLCELLLQSIHRTRTNHGLLEKGINLSYSSKMHVQKATLVKDFASFAKRGNPLSIISTSQFNEIHNRLSLLLHQLNSRHRKIKRRMTLARYCKKFLGYTLVVSCGLLAIALLVLIVHSVVGLIGAPGIMMASSFGLKRKKLKKTQAAVSGKQLERLSTQLDVAARGVYTLLNQFATMGRLAVRLEDEVERKKMIADICVKNYKRSREVSREAVREIENHKAGFLEQLDELEQHVYLCFLTINRSRSLVTQYSLDSL